VFIWEADIPRDTVDRRSCKSEETLVQRQVTLLGPVSSQ
jgi:hypothetical protein